MESWCVVVLLYMSVYIQAFPAVPQANTQSDAAVLNEIKNLFTSVSVGPSIKFGCVLEHCVKQSVGCLLDANCRSAVECAQKCMDNWENDKTPEKYHAQNCTNKCAFTYADSAYENIMACYSDNQCISFPPIKNTCRAPNVHPLKQLSIKDLTGSWWVVKGYHKVYDCYPCQRLYITPLNASSWNYTTTYETYLTNNSLELVSLHTTIQSSPAGTNISFVYNDLGLLHYETWWLIDEADNGSYMPMYYCGHTLQWNYEGALVLARNRTLSEEDYANIASSYQKAVGLDLSQFCNTSTSSSCLD